MKINFYPIIIVALLLSTVQVFGQDNMGIGTASPEPSSVLHLDATDKGFLIPRLTTPQRVAISGPATGLMVFDTDFNNFWFYDGAQWVQAIGPMGPAGADGADGADGSVGPTGAAGTNGADGADGADGAVGPTGAAGTNGADGADGADGAVGPTGAAGTNGADGADGADGAVGPTGAAGTNGADGGTGAIGPTGPTGNNGFNGSNGLDGADGAPGATGTTGPVGPAGPSGADGNDGLAGPTGPAGTNGTNGATGPSGADGTTGPAGPVGCGSSNIIVKSAGASAVCSQIYDDGSYVGVGTVAPDMKMVISDAAASFVKATSTASWAGVIADKATAADNNYFVLRTGNSDRWVLGTMGNDDFHLYDWQNGTSALYAQQATGNVGMGTTAPADRLDVNGIARVGTAAYTTGFRYDGYAETNSISDGHRLYPMPSTSTTGIGWGYIGDSDTYWYYAYSQNFIDPSRREIKRNISPVDQDIYELVMSDIDKIQPSFYKYKGETDEVEAGNEAKYRPNMHLGVILDESPDYIQDNAFSGVDVYGIATLSLAGVKHNRSRLDAVEKSVGQMLESRDFGTVEMSEESVFVPFTGAFSAHSSAASSVPVVMLTAMGPNVSVYVSNVTKEGFTIVSENGAGHSLSWMALTRVEQTDVVKGDKNRIPASLLEGLEVEESKKRILSTYEQKLKEDQIKKNNEAKVTKSGPSSSSTTEPGNK